MKNISVCYFCFSEDAGFVGLNPDFNTNIYICNRCGLIQNDYVSGSYLGDYYHKKYRKIRKETLSDKYINFMARRAASQYDFIEKSVADISIFRSVLDIGAGVGKLLENFGPDVNICAVESDSMMRAQMENGGRIHVIDESVLFGSENRGRFNLIIMSHVFEHINNPLEYLFRLHQIVAPDGYVFMEVPNEPLILVSHNVNTKKKGIGHLFDYTLDTFNAMVKKSGLFEVVQLSTFSVSVSDYLAGASIDNFEKNTKGDGIHIRCLLKKLDFVSFNNNYKYIDAVLHARYRNQLMMEKKFDTVLTALESARETIRKLKGVVG